MGKTVFSDTPPQGTIVTAAFLNAVNNHRHTGADEDGAGALNYAADTGTANAYAIALTPALTTHIVGMPIMFKAANANTGAATINVNGLGAVAIKQIDGTALPANAIRSGQVVETVYDGTNYILISSAYSVTTPEQFDNTNKIATTAFVQRALGNLQGQVHYTGNATILASDVGKIVTYDPLAVGATFQLPSTGALPRGAIVTICGYGAGTHTYTLQPQSGQDFVFHGDVKSSLILRGNDSIVIVVESSTRWNVINGPSNKIVSSVVGSFRNLKASATGTSANVSISADELILEDPNNNYLTLRDLSLTINTANSGANGLDTGALAASTWYSMWVIYNPATATVAGLISLSSTAPTLPSGYTYKARVGWIRTDETANKYPLGFTQVGRRVQYQVASGSNLTGLPIMASGTAGSLSTPTWVAIGVSNFVPPTAAVIFVEIGAGQTGVMIAPNNSYGKVGSTLNAKPPIGCVWNYIAGNPCFVSVPMILESTNIYWASGHSSNAAYAQGWEDNI